MKEEKHGNQKTKDAKKKGKESQKRCKDQMVRFSRCHMCLGAAALLLLLLEYSHLFYGPATPVYRLLSGQPSCAHLYDPHSTAFESLPEVLAAYARFHNCAASSGFAAEVLLLVDLTNGLGNRLRGLVSALTYALVTKRALLVRWNVPGRGRVRGLHLGHARTSKLPRPCEGMVLGESSSLRVRSAVASLFLLDSAFKP
jgi:hypothetical protein